MNDMNEANDTGEHRLGPLGRRDFLTKAAAAGAIAWAAPMIMSNPAYALPSGGTPKCRPAITVDCAEHMCGAFNREFPGLAVTTNGCPCSTQQPTRCIRITNLTDTAPGPIRAYRDTTTCGLTAVPDVNLADGNWHCLTNGTNVWFGPPRLNVLFVGLIIPSLADTTISFTLDVWASCPDRSPADPAFDCRTWNVTITWDAMGLLGSNGTITACTQVAQDPNSSICSGQSTAAPCTDC